MKTFIVLVTLASICYGLELSEEQKEKLRNHHKECAAVTGISKDLIDRARKGDFADDPKFKEHLFCVSKKIGFQDEAGELKIIVLKAKINVILNDVEKTEALIAKCAIKRDTPEETAYDNIKCYYDNTKEHLSVV